MSFLQFDEKSEHFSKTSEIKAILILMNYFSTMSPLER